MFYAYWDQFDQVIDYFLFDYFMLFGYQSIPEFKKLVDAVPFNNEQVKALDAMFFQAYNEKAYQALLKTNTFFKLNWKRQYPKEVEGKESTYRHFLEA